ncbi:Cyclin-dependent kinase inhibitor [Trinorchestia longiramus]|nr:Cyclin-dependent kinase inhibitor [Trinorchestia longiramus]
MNSTVAAVRRPCFAPATLCRMSELRRLAPIAADDTTINDGTTMAATTTITTTSTHHVTPMRDFVPGHLTGTTSVAQVCRNLFGPIDHEENIRFVQQELHKISSEDMLKWNYDFKTDKPLEGKYTWEPTHVAEVPDAYHTLHLNTTTESSALKSVSSATSSSRSKASTQSHSKKSRALKMPSSSVKARRTLSFSSDKEEVASPSCASDGHSRLSKEDCGKERDHDNCSSCEIRHRVTDDLSSSKEDGTNEKTDVSSTQKNSSKDALNNATAATNEHHSDKTAIKQTSMTDFLKHRKRTLSTTDEAATSSTGQPALKKIKPEQE